jgi:hypothetical protein
MGAVNQISNPFGALTSVSDHTDGYDAFGTKIGYYSKKGEFRANAAITKGAVCMWVEATTTVPYSVTPMTAAASDILFVGVADHAAAAGELVQLTLHGFCLVDVAAETSAFGSLLSVPATTTGKGEIGATHDATMVVGTAIGITLGAKDGSNLAAAWINWM